MFPPQHEQQPSTPLAERFARLHAAAVMLRAYQMLVALEIDDAELGRTIRRLQSGEIGPKLTPLLHSRTALKWTLVTQGNEFVLELGEGPLP